MTKHGFSPIHCNGTLSRGNQNILFIRSIPGLQCDGAAPGETLGNPAADPLADPSSFDGIGGNYSKAMMQLEAFLKEDERIKQGDFPRPVKLGPRAVAWLDSEVEEWMYSRLKARDAEEVV